MYALLLSIVGANTYLGYKYFQLNNTKLSYADFTKKLIYQLVGIDGYAEEGDIGTQLQVSQLDQNDAGRTLHHALVASITEKQRFQRKYIIYRRIRHKQQKKLAIFAVVMEKL